jgi:ketosteroid isomerase-like protein
VTAASETVLAPEEAEAAERWVRGFADGWRAPTSPEAFAAHFEPLLAEDIRFIQPQLPDLVGYAEFRSGFIAPLFALLGDLRGTVERWAASGDTIYIEVTVHGTLGGRPIALRACDRVTLRDGVAVERESYLDPIPLLGTVARRPRSWPRFLRYQLALVRHRMRRRSKRP